MKKKAQISDPWILDIVFGLKKTENIKVIHTVRDGMWRIGVGKVDKRLEASFETFDIKIRG